MTYTSEQRRRHIQELQKYLYTIALFNNQIPVVIPDGTYGKETALAVRAFQGMNGIKVTGETDRATWDKIVSVYRGYVDNPKIEINIFPRSDYIYRKGDNGFGVAVIQAGLLELARKYDNMKEVKITTVYDMQTEKAVSNLQMQTGLPVNGHVDLRTWNVIAGTIK